MVTTSSAARRRLARAGAGGAVVLGAAASYSMWSEAVDYRATSGEGILMVWAMPPSALSTVLFLWLVTALLDRDRDLAVVILSVALVVTALTGAFAVFAATERYPTLGAVGASPRMTAALPMLDALARRRSAQGRQIPSVPCMRRTILRCQRSRGDRCGVVRWPPSCSCSQA